MFKAKYNGRCPACGDIIEEGDLLDYNDDNQVVHATPDCMDKRAPLAKPREVCPSCHFELPVSGVCGECNG